jgi:hypothetical protein
MRTKLPYLKVFFFMALIMGGLELSAQCKYFTQRKCLPQLSPYQNNGQINTTVLFEGDSASLRMTFFSEQEYRLVVCSHTSLGDSVYFKIRDLDNELLYNSKGKDNVWDFKVNSTQDLSVDVIVPRQANNMTGLPQSGCVSVILGFKP